jgi:hypothetical protein
MTQSHFQAGCLRTLLGAHQLQLASDARVARIARQGLAEQALGFVEIPALERDGAQQGVGLVVAQGSGVAGLALRAIQVALVKGSLGPFEQRGPFR